MITTQNQLGHTRTYDVRAVDVREGLDMLAAMYRQPYPPPGTAVDVLEGELIRIGYLLVWWEDPTSVALRGATALPLVQS
jgi:hypothetical protein